MQIDWTTQVHSPKGGWREGGYSTKLGSAPWSNPLPAFIYHFWQKRYPLLGNDMPFTHLINIASLLTAVNALSFKYEILAKLCLKLENGTPSSAFERVPPAPPPGYTVFKRVYLPSQYGSPNERNFCSLMIIVQEEKKLLAESFISIAQFLNFIRQ